MFSLNQQNTSRLKRYSIWLMIVALVVSLSISVFLGSELLKKFGFMADFVKNSRQTVALHYEGSMSPGMRNIVLRGAEPFSALVGFTFDIPLLGFSGYDYYGFVHSDEHGIAVISTYMGKGSCEFQFFVNTDLNVNPITATSTDDDQTLSPQVVYPAHWWQKLGFYG